jgi:hypothetical protein
LSSKESEELIVMHHLKSPFPGMDPYLEQHWGDVHASLIVYMRDQINEQLPADLQARVEESIMVDHCWMNVTVGAATARSITLGR